jgi:CRISPR/Cas system-associated exonuclease Cas4 (RecB family)
MILTNENYYSSEANWEYMSVSQYKQFMKCEAAAMAQLRGEWETPKTIALLVGSYIDAWFEGTLDEFKADHPEIYTKTGKLKADFEQAEEIIAFVQKDPMFMRYMAGKKQIILTAEFFGTKWKIKIDSYHPDKIVDLKVMRSMERIMGKSFVEHWGYDLQMAVYSKVEGRDLATYLAVVTKQDPPDKNIVSIPRWRRVELLEEVEGNMPRILAVKSGKHPPQRCETCEYCRATKMLTEPIDFELVGLSATERRAILGA